MVVNSNFGKKYFFSITITKNKTNNREFLKTVENKLE